MNSIRTPLAFVRGLGSAKDGTHHWWVQRVTSVLLVPLVIWFAIKLLSVARGDYATFQEWLSNPVCAGFMITFLLTGFYHAALGMQVIYEDYVRPESVKVIAVVMTQVVLVLLSVISVVAVLKVALA